MRIAVDAMGADHGWQVLYQGVEMALQSHPELQVSFLGDMQIIQPDQLKDASPRISFIHCSQTISTEENPLAAIHSKKDSSLTRGLVMLKEGEADAFLSCGSTGAVVAGSFLIVGRIKGVQRVALAPTLPTATGKALLIDSGANADSQPDYLVQFAHMGSAYMELVQHIPNPRVGLVNIGVEEEKGNALYREVHHRLKDSGLNFVGNVEARDVLAGLADVLVADGFTGNVLLKTMEGTAGFLLSELKDIFYRNAMTKLAAAILKPGLMGLRRRMDYAEHGGAPLLGINGCVIKGHGSSKAKAVAAAVSQAVTFTENKVHLAIAERLGR